jgi:hypothetical protein
LQLTTNAWKGVCLERSLMAFYRWQWVDSVLRCKLASQVWWYPFFQPWGHKVQHLLITLGRLKIFFLFQAFSPTLKPLGLISTFAPLGMLGLSWTLGLDS